MTANRSMPPGIFIPVLGYEDVAEAAAFLCKAFGFSRRLVIGSHRIQLCYRGASVVVTDHWTPDAPSQANHSVMVSVENVDAQYHRAVEAGARTVSEPRTYPFGERQCTIEDPGGHRWTFSQTVADVAPAEWGGEFVEECL